MRNAKISRQILEELEDFIMSKRARRDYLLKRQRFIIVFLLILGHSFQKTLFDTRLQNAFRFWNTK